MSFPSSFHPTANQQQPQQQQDQLYAMQNMPGATGPSQQQQGGGLQMPSQQTRASLMGMDPITRGLSSTQTSTLDSHIADLFASRRSNQLDDLLSRRNNSSALDDTTAVLDACILDLTRRRLGMSMTGGGGGSGPTNSQGFDTNAMATMGLNAGASSSSGGGGGPSLAARQQQLQKQQFELEQRQKELERQRQQLLAGMQETSMQASGLKAAASIRSPEQSTDRQQQWWVCQVCNSKAFSSREEAVQHESMCTHGGGARGSIADIQQGMGGVPYGATMPPGMAMNNGLVGNGTSSIGPFSMLPQPMAISMPSDKDWLTPLHCFVRRHCVEIFCASVQDVATPSKGKRKPIQVGQVGIRCPHCHSQPGGAKERGSVYYPTAIGSIYNATMNLLQRHLHSCSAVPEDIMAQYRTLKADDARSGTSKKYWVESALSLGLVDTPSGIRYSALAPPPLPRLSRQQHSTGAYSANRRNSNDFFSTKSNAVADLARRGGMDGTGLQEDPNASSSKAQSKSTPLVTNDDKPYATTFSFFLMSQMRSCVFTEADRLGKRKGLPPGFSGLACRHCFGGYGSGRFFPSSIKTLSDTSKTLNVLHNHMMRCRKCPLEVKSTLEKLRETHDEERAKMKFGSQKAFFAKVWRRLHENDGALHSMQQQKNNSVKRSLSGYGNAGAMTMPAPPIVHNQATMDWAAMGGYNDSNKRQRMGPM